MNYIGIDKQLQKKQCMEKMEKIQSIPSDKFTVTHQKQYDKLIRVVTTIQQEVKQNIHHVYRGEVAWSPQYKQGRDEKRIWVKLQKYRKKNTGKIQA